MTHSHPYAGPRRPTAIAALLGLALALLPALGAAPARAEAVEPRRLTVAGTPEQVGRALGEAYAAELKQLHPLFLTIGQVMTGQPAARLHERAEQIAATMDGRDLAEIRGLAAGAGLEYRDVLFLNLFYNLTLPAMGCRQLAVWGPAAAGQTLLHARNLDWMDYPGGPLQRHHLILNLQPHGEQELLLLTWPGLLGALTGTNRAGLTVAFNALPNGPDRQRLAEPTFFTLKRILRDCTSLDEAVALVREARPMGNGSVMISSAREGRAVVAEIYDGRVGVREAAADDAAGGGMIGNANHMTAEAGLEGVRVGPAAAPTCEVARELEGALDTEVMVAVMSHPRVLQDINILSVVFVPAENRMLLSSGTTPAAKGEFREYRLFEPAEAAAARRDGAAAAADTSLLSR